MHFSPRAVGWLSYNWIEFFQRREKALVSALCEMYVQGVSTRRSKRSVRNCAERSSSQQERGANLPPINARMTSLAGPDAMVVMLSVDQFMDIVLLHKEGHSLRQIAKLTGLSHNTIRRALRQGRPASFRRPGLPNSNLSTLTSASVSSSTAFPPSA